MLKNMILTCCCFVVMNLGGVIQAASVDSNVQTHTETEQAQDASNHNVVAPKQSMTNIVAPKQEMSLKLEASKPKVGAHISPEMHYPFAVSNLTSGADKGPRFMSMLNLMKYKSVKIGEPVTFTRKELAEISKNAKNFWGNTPGLQLRLLGGEKNQAVDSITVAFYPLITLTKKTGKDTTETTLTYSGKQSNFAMRGVAHCKDANGEQVSLDLLAIILTNAMDNGLNAADIVYEDVVDVLDAETLGVGTAISGASSSNPTAGNAVSAVGGGGTGWSNATAFHDKYPYMKAILGRI